MQFEHESGSSLFMTLCRAELNRLLQQCLDTVLPRLHPSASQIARNAPQPAESTWKDGQRGRQDGHSKCIAIQAKWDLEGTIGVSST
jgi:hypothetical protein